MYVDILHLACPVNVELLPLTSRAAASASRRALRSCLVSFFSLFVPPLVCCPLPLAIAAAALFRYRLVYLQIFSIL